MSGEFLKRLSQLVIKGTVKTEEPMKDHTTFRVGGPADYFVMPGTVQEIRDVLELCRQEQQEVLVVGNGSNLLIGDKGFRGLVLCLGKPFSALERDGIFLKAQCGILLSKLAREAEAAGLSGLEFASGIPGTLGGALFMNAGAYGGEMKQVVEEITWLLPDGTIQTLPAKEAKFGYRFSQAQKNGAVFLEAKLSLKPGNQEQIRKKAEELNQKRRQKQPLEYPSGGSTFKRPEGYFAGKLIEEAGLAGLRVGGASVSVKHCGFVINDGNGTAEDILNLCRLIQQKVGESSGVRLELEIRTAGEF